MATQQMTEEETEFRKDVGFAATLPANVLTALFACPSCNWPIVTSKFTDRANRDDLHEQVFELMCPQCKWKGAMLGRDIVDHMVADWSGRKVRNYSAEK